MSVTVSKGFLESHDPERTLVLVRHVTTISVNQVPDEGWHVYTHTVDGRTQRVTRNAYPTENAAERYAAQIISDIEDYLAAITQGRR